MALADKVKGLKKHKIEVPPPAAEPVKPFDFERADRHLRELNDSVGAKYPDGCIEWLAANRQDISQALIAGENAVDLAYLAEDLPALINKLDLLNRMYLKAFDVFNTRPPVIEVQADLAL